MNVLGEGHMACFAVLRAVGTMGLHVNNVAFVEGIGYHLRNFNRVLFVLKVLRIT